jgi:hypothetical protein
MDYLRQGKPPKDGQGSLNYFLHMHFLGLWVLSEGLPYRPVTDKHFRDSARPAAPAFPGGGGKSMNNRRDIAGQLRVTCLGAAANEFGLCAFRAPSSAWGAVEERN